MITLLTDFGTRDSYVAEMKAVILRLNSQAAIVDVTHEIEPQAVAEGAVVLGRAYQVFAPDAVHIAVVDPDVGTARNALLLMTPEGRFLAPDNGLITYAVRESPEYEKAIAGAGFLQAVAVPIPAGFAAYRLSNEALWRRPVSDTFHGRDVFAPVAAHLSLGLPPQEVGEPVASLTCLSIPHPRRRGDEIAGHVVHVDRFGNLSTTIGGDAVEGRDVGVAVGGNRIRGISRSYAEGGELLAVIGSGGSLEIAVRDGSAARSLGVRVGEPVVVRL
ncbi:MAG: SAM-dependent chlorinase/fluorinase [Chloroflexota bacterium]|nr:SAM-dependent chlorinase/fluorinase [Chloroflexota bacterium]MDE2942377.1 SAM-dependent chlorinase/fluorinase [Chloroflexota bacterium]MDE3267943.1 SAM-dependent chlorinase/fluorinase [Chloroflexota bacterium]